MCTSITYKSNDFYFGRNMDLDYHFGERVVITPRNYEFSLKHEKIENSHYAIIGMATVKNNYPLYADGVNEVGLCVSAQNFPGNAFYHKSIEYGKINLAPYEIIPYILSNFSSVNEVKSMLSNLRIIDTPFNENTGVSPLHWHVADEFSSIVIESTLNGLKIHDNPAGVMTNNPPFDSQIRNLENYNHLKPAKPPQNAHTLGLGLYGLPGDFTSTSRFVKASILRKFSICESDEKSSVLTVFRIMYAVAPLKGTTLTKDGKDHYTTYTSVINATKGFYYYTTTENLAPIKASLFDKNIDASTLFEA